MPHADVNGQRIFFEDSGGPGPALVLAHGFLMDQTMFDPQVAALAPDVRVIRWDERAHGRTEWDGLPFTYWDSASDCIGLLDHLEIDQAVVGGMSQGGFLSLRAALMYADRILGLVLIDTQAGVEDAETMARYRGMVDSWLEMGPVEPLVNAIAGIIIGAPEHWEPWVGRFRETSPERVRGAADCLLGRDDITARVAEILCPAIVFHGTGDIAISMERAAQLSSALSGCEALVRVEGAGHSANLTHPAGVNPALREFVLRHG
jgi:3-oxoadipate enol-lactonase